MRLTLRDLLFSTAAIAAPLAASPALAQAETGAPSVVGEVIVTAQKRSESVQEVPASITAVSSQTIEERGINQVSDLRFLAPNVQVGYMAGTTNVIIRGVGLNLVSVGTAPPGVALSVDGVFQPVPAMGDLTQIDMERIEVLRGPQGTLYGRNANGGAVNFITKRPTSELEGYLQAGYATYQETHLQGVVNMPLNDRLRMRAVFDWSDRGEGFIENVVPGNPDLGKGEKLLGRLAVSADLGENLALDLTGGWLRARGSFTPFVLHGLPTALAISNNPILAQAIAPQDSNRTSAEITTELDRDASFVAGTLTWDVGDLQLKSITGLQRLSDAIEGDNDGLNIRFLNQRHRFRNRTMSQELNASVSRGPLDGVLGAFYMHQRDFMTQSYTFPNGFRPLAAGSELVYTQNELSTKASAIFADATWKLTDQLRLIAGVRFSKEDVSNTPENWVTSPAGVRAVSCPRQTNSVEFSSTTTRAGAQYDVTDASNVYATYSTGFKSGGFNRTACNQQYKPEEIVAYEIGTKNRFFDNTLTLNASAFYYEYSDMQLVQVFTLGTAITNAAAAEIKGLEFEGLWQPNYNWTVNANLTFLDAKYTSYSNIDTLAPSLGNQDLSGNYLNNAPKQSANVGVSYRTDMLENGQFTFRVDVGQRTKIYFREFNLPADSQDGYTVVNLAVIWDSPDEKYRVRAYANNLTDTGYLTALFAVNNFGSYQASWGSPRQIGIELRANF